MVIVTITSISVKNSNRHQHTGTLYMRCNSILAIHVHILKHSILVYIDEMTINRKLVHFK